MVQVGGEVCRLSAGVLVAERVPEGLYWSAPVALDADFSMEDPLALDYLHQQVGLWLFPGFTTRTGRAQNYAVVLYGLWLAERAIQVYGLPGDDRKRTELFERWERFWALATMEFRGGRLEQSDDDSMRGVRGATRAWFPGNGPLPLDFPLISRQSELGSLGAYLSSVREYQLVWPGTLKVTPAAKPILDAFWSEPGERATHHLYEEYALEALDPGRTKIPRSHGRLSLAGVGKRSRLSSLVHRKRQEQQERLWRVLFAGARDTSTLSLAELLIAAHADGVEEPEALLEGFADEKWGPLDSELAAKVEVALVFGRVARVLLSRFDRAYEAVYMGGWVADRDRVARAAFPEEEMGELRSACRAVLEARHSGRFRKLQFHGPGFMGTLAGLLDGGPDACLEQLLRLHRVVQRSRRGGGAWLREQDGKLVIQVSGYNGYKSEPRFFGFKLNVVRRLLRDLGKMA